MYMYTSIFTRIKKGRKKLANMKTGSFFTQKYNDARRILNATFSADSDHS